MYTVSLRVKTFREWELEHSSQSCGGYKCGGCITFLRNRGPQALSRFQAEVMLKRLLSAPIILGMQASILMPSDAPNIKPEGNKIQG
jgi:hypothetical protein